MKWFFFYFGQGHSEFRRHVFRHEWHLSTIVSSYAHRGLLPCALSICETKCPIVTCGNLLVINILIYLMAENVSALCLTSGFMPDIPSDTNACYTPKVCACLLWEQQLLVILSGSANWLSNLSSILTVLQTSVFCVLRFPQIAALFIISFVSLPYVSWY